MRAPQIIIFDFGSQFTHLILRELRARGIYCVIDFPDTRALKRLATAGHRPKGIILSGGPRSVTPRERVFAKSAVRMFPDIPILGICYGMQLIASVFGHKVHAQKRCEYGPEKLNLRARHSLLKGLPRRGSDIWMSHGDHVELGRRRPAKTLAFSSSGTLAAAEFAPRVMGVQFHPEVSHTTFGREILSNFAFSICGAGRDWSPKQIFIDAYESIQAEIVKPKRRVLCAVSGGVDSTVLAAILTKTCRRQTHFIHVDHGLGRHNESAEVIRSLRALGIPVKLIRAESQFVDALRGIKNPERKRKIIGKTFIDIFEKYAAAHGLTHLVQGTLYPDKIESRPHVGKSSTIKTHHNVGGIPKQCRLGIIEPFQHFYKDDVRKLGRQIKMPAATLARHPFPGPGLAIRVVGAVTPERLRILRASDHIMTTHLKRRRLYDDIWQSACMLLPIRSVGVKGDTRTYQPAIAIRCVVSQNAMTAHAARLPIEELEAIATAILNQVPEIGRVVYDISPKPPATIEWE